MEDISKLRLKECSKLMEILEIPDDDVDNVEEARAELIKAKTKSQEKAGWSPGKAFSAFDKAREEDLSKRKELFEIYQKVEETIVGKCTKELLEILKEYFGYHVQVEFAKKKEELRVKEYIVLFAGETSSGKSSLINLILGDEFLPYRTLPATSTICEVRFGRQKKIKIHYKDGNRKSEEINLSDSKDGKSFVEQLEPYLIQETDRDQGNEYAKIEIFWNHELLKNGIVIVDSPGIGEYPEMDQYVIDYLTKAFAFVYVINVGNGGGVQEDRIVKLLKHVREKSPSNFVPESALFVCNKWDHVIEREREKTAEHIIQKLVRNWPNVDSQSQVVQLSTTNAAYLQKYGIITEQFINLITAVKSMMLKTTFARLERDCSAKFERRFAVL